MVVHRNPYSTLPTLIPILQTKKPRIRWWKTPTCQRRSKTNSKALRTTRPTSTSARASTMVMSWDDPSSKEGWVLYARWPWLSWIRHRVVFLPRLLFAFPPPHLSRQEVSCPFRFFHLLFVCSTLFLFKDTCILYVIKARLSSFSLRVDHFTNWCRQNLLIAWTYLLSNPCHPSTCLYCVFEYQRHVLCLVEKKKRRDVRHATCPITSCKPAADSNKVPAKTGPCVYSIRSDIVRLPKEKKSSQCRCRAAKFNHRTCPRPSTRPLKGHGESGARGHMYVRGLTRTPGQIILRPPFCHPKMTALESKK